MDYVMPLVRWIHLFFGIAWIGHLFYFNLVQVHAEKALGPDQKKVVVPNFRGRAIWWFRWGAMFTFVSGLLYIFLEELFVNRLHFRGWLSYGPDGRAAANMWILFGGLLGTIMWFNVWFVIWPRQRVIIASVAGLREKPAEFDRLVAVAAKFSKINFYLAAPMLFGMLGRSHFPITTSWGQAVAWWVGVLVVGVGIAVHVLMAAGRVGTEFTPKT
ncbi:MAG TPA: urate hydroxylase PuuD [Planctomycetota bacterium]|nr:urate hydroxylase PuuD [Planctomycetota bacterium]